MAELNETPSGNRTRIAFFGLRNAGKSTLINAIAGQPLAIVSDIPGTTADPVSKAMELLPLGPCLLTDTAGLDDEGPLGELRVRKSLDVLSKTDIAVWVAAADAGDAAPPQEFVERCRRASVPVIEVLNKCDLLPHPANSQTRQLANSPTSPQLANSPTRQLANSLTSPRPANSPTRQLANSLTTPHPLKLSAATGAGVDALKKALSSVRVDTPPPLLSGMVKPGDLVACVCPIDESAPKGRLILPQQQVIRELLDMGALALVCQPAELAARFEAPPKFRPSLVVTDSQAFGAVAAAIPPGTRLTSFSILFARQKGDVDEFVRGLAAARNLRDGARVLVAEGCTHHRQCNDIGAVKIPKALAKLSGGRTIECEFASGNGFPSDLGRYSLVVHCGGCMLTRRVVMGRISACREANVPIVNYGILLAAAAGVRIEELER